MVREVRTRWMGARRIIPSRHPPIDLYEQVSDPADLDAVFYIEGLTDERVREERGLLANVAPEDRMVGPGAQYIMPAFTRFNLNGSRFSDGSYGVFYVGADLQTAVAESVYHHACFLRDSDMGLVRDIQMRAYAVDVDSVLADLRHDALPEDINAAEIYDPDNYAAAQRVGVQLRKEGCNGVRYQSVRRPTGECVGLLKPKAVARCVQAELLIYHWNGEEIADVDLTQPLDWR